MNGATNFSERCYPELMGGRVRADHLARYEFVTKYVQGKRVLDLGCGEGYGAEILLRGGATEVIGIDNDNVIIAHAKEKYPGIRFYSAEATMTELPDASLDAVVAFEVWHHLDTWEKFIPEVSRILKKGGLFIASVPNERAIYLNPMHQRMLTEFYRHDFDKNEIRGLLKKNFLIKAWYGQRFVHPMMINPIVRFTLYLVSHLVPSFGRRIDRAYKLANGPQVLPLSGENCRTLIVVAEKL